MAVLIKIPIKLVFVRGVIDFAVSIAIVFCVPVSFGIYSSLTGTLSI